MATSQNKTSPLGASQHGAVGRDSGVGKTVTEGENALSAKGRKRRLLTEAQEAEVRELRELASQTRRVTVPELEEILYEPLPVLDHGFVRVIDYMGDDAAIVQAGRVS